MYKITKEETRKNIKKAIIEEVARFIAFTIVIIAISSLFAAILPVGIYWIWLTKTESDVLYLAGYEIVFGIVWIMAAFCWGATNIKNGYHRKMNVLNRKVHAIYRRYEISSIRINDLG